jgi:hypothetical protein
MSKPSAVPTRPRLSLMLMLASANGRRTVLTCLTMLGRFRGVLVTITVTRLGQWPEA